MHAARFRENAIILHNTVFLLYYTNVLKFPTTEWHNPQLRQIFEFSYAEAELCKHNLFVTITIIAFSKHATSQY